MLARQIEQIVRMALDRAINTALPAPEDELAILGNRNLWFSETLVRLANKYGPMTPEVVRLVEAYIARDPKMKFALQVSGLEWQPDIVVALSEAAIKEQGPNLNPLLLLLE